VADNQQTISNSQPMHSSFLNMIDTYLLNFLHIPILDVQGHQTGSCSLHY